MGNFIPYQLLSSVDFRMMMIIRWYKNRNEQLKLVNISCDENGERFPKQYILSIKANNKKKNMRNIVSCIQIFLQVVDLSSYHSSKHKTHTYIYIIGFLLMKIFSHRSLFVIWVSKFLLFCVFLCDSFPIVYGWWSLIASNWKSMLYFQMESNLNK